MMKSFNARSALILLFCGLLMLQQSESFSPTAHLSTRRSTTTELAAWNGGNGGRRRREVFKWAKRTAVLGFGLKTASSLPKAAVAEEQGGRIVTFTVDNLSGEEGKTGTFKIQLVNDWAPKGVARFEELSDANFWDDCRFFRVLPGFVVQFGINGNPEVQKKWRSANLPDDQVRVSNERGTVVFATAGPNSRTSQLFINTREGGNGFLDKQGFSPIGRVIEGMDVVDQMYAGYGEGAPAGRGPNQGKIQLEGNRYLRENFPKLTYIQKAS